MKRVAAYAIAAVLALAGALLWAALQARPQGGSAAPTLTTTPATTPPLATLTGSPVSAAPPYGQTTHAPPPGSYTVVVAQPPFGSLAVQPYYTVSFNESEVRAVLDLLKQWNLTGVDYAKWANKSLDKLAVLRVGFVIANKGGSSVSFYAGGCACNTALQAHLVLVEGGGVVAVPYVDCQVLCRRGLLPGGVFYSREFVFLVERPFKGVFKYGTIGGTEFCSDKTCVKPEGTFEVVVS
ncbi:hypothetical protein WLZ34_01565 [Thermogladius sp. KZ2Tp1]|uniref:hypothetical protein n=1 Tax=Thermogladius sp. KZ2Tp1 TaxID=3136289 RepID=UPI003DA867C4